MRIVSQQKCFPFLRSKTIFGPVHTTPKKFENDVFTLKTHMFPVHTTPEKFENAPITGHFGFVFEETSVRKIT